MIQEIEVDKIISKNILNERENIEADEPLISLASSIKEHGLIHPIVIKKIDDNNYQVVCGQRRLMAHKLAGISTIPSLVKDFSNQKDELLYIIEENSKRINLNAYEKYKLICKTLYLLSLENVSDETLNSPELDKKIILYFKDIISIKVNISKNTKDEHKKLNTFKKNCKILNISYSNLLNDNYLNTTDKRIIELLSNNRISLKISYFLHKLKIKTYFNELMNYIIEKDNIIDIEQIKAFCKAKETNKNKEVSKETLISLINDINDKKSLLYIEKVIKKLENKINSKKG